MTGTKKPRLKNLDDLFELTGGENPLDSSVPIMDTQPTSTRSIVSTAIELLTPFRDHLFRLYEGERLDDMVESIRKNGVLVPVIVRRIGKVLEILSGHNRVNAAKLAGLEKVSTIILEKISDEDALVYVIETNLIQRSFTDMSYSEKAAVIALHHSKMFSQGKRNDILEQIKTLENPDGCKAGQTCSQVGNKLKTISKVGQEYGLAKNTIARYLRINKLISALKILLDNGDIAFIPAVALSYLEETEQTLLVECMEQSGLSVDGKKADMLRQFSDKGKLSDEGIRRILTGETRPKPNRTPTVKVRKDVYARYFQSGQSAREVQTIVEKALEMYFEQQ